jgi:hypothetical protein
VKLPATAGSALTSHELGCIAVDMGEV